MFAIITILAVLAAGLAVAHRRFRAQRPAGEANVKNISATGNFIHWSVRRAPASLIHPAPAGWPAWVKGFRLWRLPVLEKWLLIGLYGSFLYLAASGFFFAILIKRGLYGFPLVLHVFAGAIFAVCLAVAAFLRARRYAFNPEPLAFPADLESVKVLPIFLRTQDWAKWFFWLFLLAGFSLTVSALLPMLPWFPYEGQIILFSWHRWSALVSLLAAIGFADVELFAPRPDAI
jgi:hypothetical protein